MASRTLRGTTISVNDGASNAQAVFSKPTSIKLPQRKTETEKFTLTNQGNNVVQKVAKNMDLGTFEFTIQFSEADLIRLYAVAGLDYITGTTPVTFVVTTTNADAPKTHTITGIVDVDPGEITGSSIPDTKVSVDVTSYVVATAS